MRPSLENAVDAKAEILLAAEECFGESGYAGTSVQDIIKQTRFSKPVIYYHFGNKEGLFFAVMEDVHVRSFAAMTEAFETKGTVRNRLIAMFISMFDFLREREAIARLIFANAFTSSQNMPENVTIQEHRQRKFDLFASLVKEGQESGELDPSLDLKITTHGIYAALVFSLMNHLTQKDSVPLDQNTAEQLVDLYLNGAASKTVR